MVKRVNLGKKQPDTAGRHKSDADNANPRKIGYGSPPRHTQFKKGQSGNPKGRPKWKTKKISEILAEELVRPVIIDVKGRREKVTSMQAVVRTVVAKAEAGDPKDLMQLLRLAGDRKALDALGPKPPARRLPGVESATSLVEAAAYFKESLDETYDEEKD